MIKRSFSFALSVALLLMLGANVRAQPTSALLKTIKAVGKEGVGNAAATQALAELTKRGPVVLVEILAAMKNASPVATNYLRAAAETIFDAYHDAGKPIPAKELNAFLADHSNDHNARRLAYELLVRLNPTSADQYLPNMLDDASPELRREAVDYLLRNLERLEKSPQQPPALNKFAKVTLHRALEKSRDVPQIKRIVKKLKEVTGEVIDLTQRLGFITQWQLLGPFDNTDGLGFHKAYTPEKSVQLDAAYVGKGDKKLRWTAYTTKTSLGVVDFNKVYSEEKGVIGYGFVALESPREQAVLIRAGSNNAVKMFLNGKEIYSREEYHHGMAIDQHTARGKLKVGRNSLLIKVCQNEQTDSWARLWSFQLRVTDPVGGPVPLTVLTDKQAAPKGGQP